MSWRHIYNLTASVSSFFTHPPSQQLIESSSDSSARDSPLEVTISAPGRGKVTVRTPRTFKELCEDLPPIIQLRICNYAVHGRPVVNPRRRSDTTSNSTTSFSSQAQAAAQVTTQVHGAQHTLNNHATSDRLTVQDVSEHNHACATSIPADTTRSDLQHPLSDLDPTSYNKVCAEITLDGGFGPRYFIFPGNTPSGMSREINSLLAFGNLSDAATETNTRNTISTASRKRSFEDESERASPEKKRRIDASTDHKAVRNNSAAPVNNTTATNTTSTPDNASTNTKDVTNNNRVTLKVAITSRIEPSAAEIKHAIDTKLPQELRDMIEDWTFCGGPKQTIDANYKSPSALSVSRATRRKYAASHYRFTTFATSSQSSLRKWLLSLPPLHRNVIQRIHFDITPADEETAAAHAAPQDAKVLTRKERKAARRRHQYSRKINYDADGIAKQRAEARKFFVVVYLKGKGLKLDDSVLRFNVQYAGMEEERWSSTPGLLWEQWLKFKFQEAVKAKELAEPENLEGGVYTEMGEGAETETLDNDDHDVVL